MLKWFRFRKEKLKELMMYGFIVVLSMGLLYFAITFEPTPWMPDIRKERLEAEKMKREGVKSREIPLMREEEPTEEELEDLKNRAASCDTFCKKTHQVSGTHVIGKLKVEEDGTLTCLCFKKKLKRIEA